MSQPSNSTAAYDQCIHCGMCLPACPTYDTTKHERNSPRGRISLMRAIGEKEMPVTKGFADEMSYCLGCLACQTACPAGVDYASLFEDSRAIIEHSGVNRSASRDAWRFITLDFLFTRPRVLRNFGKVIRLFQASGLQAFTRRLHLTRLLPASLRRLEPQTPTIAAKFSNELIDPIETPTTGIVRHRVALLTGCIQDLVYSEINRDSADVLLANDCEVHTPPVQPCCGSLHSHNGATELARELALRLIALLPPEKFDAIITNAGGCGSHLRHFSKLLPDHPSAKIWDSKVRDIHEFLAEIKITPPVHPPFPEPVNVTYHDSCHLSHGQRVTLQPRQIIDLIPGVKRVNLTEADWCCGSAGIYSITQPEQSKLLLDRKAGHIKATGAEILLTANPGCHLQIQRALPDLKILHPVSLLARAYRAPASVAANSSRAGSAPAPHR